MLLLKVLFCHNSLPPSLMVTLAASPNTGTKIRARLLTGTFTSRTKAESFRLQLIAAGPRTVGMVALALASFFTTARLGLRFDLGVAGLERSDAGDRFQQPSRQRAAKEGMILGLVAVRPRFPKSSRRLRRLQHIAPTRISRLPRQRQRHIVVPGVRQRAQQMQRADDASVEMIGSRSNVIRQ